MNETEMENRELLSKTGRRVIARIDKLPSLSNVITEFLEASKNELTTGKDLERIIIKDQALVSRLLKLANSSLFGRSRSINSITEAIVMIGMENMKKIVYAVSSEGLMRQNFKVYQYPDKGFWLHSMGVGITCRALNEKLPEAVLEDEQAFVAGLVHDAGKLIIDDFLDQEPGMRPVNLKMEIDSVGIDHAALGELIMNKWNIPDPIAVAVRHHHQPRASGGPHLNALLVSLADGICNFWGVGTQPFMDLGEEIEPESCREALEALKISASGLQDTLWEVRQKLANLEDLYRLGD
ncbi:MAG: HDOD domain-containing protein [Candidatus Krumholzibacteriota bacterium]|nr:HDOD domain-containing protein [Candidatus Krumholzibacteriota bacterium]